MPDSDTPHEDDAQISQQEIDDIVAGMLSDEDLRTRSESLDTAQEVWEEAAYLHNPKMPCPSCSGAGQVKGGSLGDICVQCMGARVLEQPGSVPLQMPPFAELRAAITKYGDARADRELPDGHKGKRNLSLPPAATVPTFSAIAEIHSAGLARVRELAVGPGALPQLAEPEPKQGLLSEDGHLGDYSDHELDQAEHSLAEKPKKKPKRGPR